MEHPTDEGGMEPPQKGMHTQKLGAQVGTHVNHTHPVRAGAPHPPSPKLMLHWEKLPSLSLGSTAVPHLESWGRQALN